MNYDTATLLCPECGSYLYDKQVGFSHYKSCNSCGYARINQVTAMSLISDAVGEGISPIIDRPELLRPDERRQQRIDQIEKDNWLIKELNKFGRD